MQVLSLFDGMGCGWIALRELGIVPDKCYSSEVDKYAIQQVMHNFPEVIHLGDVTKWREWNIEWGKIGLLIGGSPCQGFSMSGKQLAFDDPRSALFFVFVDILNHIRQFNPNVKFLLENVNMKKEHMRVINDVMGVIPIRINSSLVSAQNRDRFYWTNIRTRKEGLFGELYSDIPQPGDRGILLKDVLEENVDEKYYLKDDVVDKLLKHKHRQEENGRGFGAVFHDKESKMQALKVGGKGVDDLVCVGRHEPKILNKDYRIRRLTPTECARLQTIPTWYDWTVSPSQQYKMLGNGWTIEVIKHILSYLKSE